MSQNMSHLSNPNNHYFFLDLWQVIIINYLKKIKHGGYADGNIWEMWYFIWPMHSDSLLNKSY